MHEWKHRITWREAHEFIEFGSLEAKNIISIDISRLTRSHLLVFIFCYEYAQKSENNGINNKYFGVLMNESNELSTFAALFSNLFGFRSEIRTVPIESVCDECVALQAAYNEISVRFLCYK